jgi:hypothetical protein
MLYSPSHWSALYLIFHDLICIFHLFQKNTEMWILKISCVKIKLLIEYSASEIFTWFAKVSYWALINCMCVC